MDTIDLYPTLAAVASSDLFANSSPHPWFLDTCNELEIVIKDSRGNLVLYEDLGDCPPEIPTSVIEEANRQRVANARLMVILSELLANVQGAATDAKDHE